MSGALAVADGRAVGLAHWLTHRSTWSIADVCYLNDLFVVPDRRGQGIGRALIEHVAAAAAAAGCSQLYWLTHQTNTTAQRLYDGVAERTGFIHFGRKLHAAPGP
jgi:GNAT superfamily N-acetyltransferase